MHKTKEEREAPTEATEGGGHVLTNGGLLGELALEQDAVWLREGRSDGLLTSEGFAELGLPDLDFALLGVLVRDGDLGLLGGQDCEEMSEKLGSKGGSREGRTIDEWSAFWSSPDSVLGGANELEVRDGEVVFELGEERGNGGGW